MLYVEPFSVSSSGRRTCFCCLVHKKILYILINIILTCPLSVGYIYLWNEQYVNCIVLFYVFAEF